MKNMALVVLCFLAFTYSAFAQMSLNIKTTTDFVEPYMSAFHSSSHLGVYFNLNNEQLVALAAQVPITPAGMAYRSMSKILQGYEFNKLETEKLKLPSQADGAAFKQAETGEVIYCLWAKTEGTEVVYTFPFTQPDAQGDSIANVAKMKWDYSQIDDIAVLPFNNVKLTTTPAFYYQTAVVEKAFHKDEPIAHTFDEKKGEITITYKTENEGLVNLKIFSVEIKDFISIYDNQPMAKGFHQRILSTKEWKEGLYVIQMIIDKKPYTRKLLIGKPK